ncbi:HmuY family protein [Candidatus Palauibacter sp.]|uniref:HmuY family protein n=1 Tax=Candidatus Palauibacter sp. TaxID=3101350 RepID=UPI003B0101E7
MTAHTYHSRCGLAALAVLLPLFAACESEVAAPDRDQVFEEGTITLDASSHTGFAYLSLADGGSRQSPADPGGSTAWHMAFRRFSVRLNGGVAGPGSVSAVNLGNNSTMTADAITALTPVDGEAAFTAVTEADIPGTGSFTADALVPDPGASWFRFDRQSGSIVANPGAAWKVREGSGRGYAVFRIVAITMQGQRPVGVTVQSRRQDPGGSLAPSETLDVDLSRGPAYVGLSGGIVMDPASCDWDIGMSPEFTIQVNEACGAGTFPLDLLDDFMALGRADDAPDYAGFLSSIGGAFPAAVGDARGTFWYNIRENNRMWPTYNVFLVRVADEVYKVQITDYYDATGTSGFPTVRFQRLR